MVFGGVTIWRYLGNIHTNIKHVCPSSICMDWRQTGIILEIFLLTSKLCMHPSSVWIGNDIRRMHCIYVEKLTLFDRILSRSELETWVLAGDSQSEYFYAQETLNNELWPSLRNKLIKSNFWEKKICGPGHDVCVHIFVNMYIYWVNMRTCTDLGYSMNVIACKDL